MENQIELDETSDIISSNKVEGTSVYDSEGNNLGSIYNFMVNKRSGQVEYAAMRFGGFLGIGSDYYPIPWDMLTYDTDKGGYQVDISKDLLENAPRYDENSEPVFDQSYGRDLYGYYGVPYSF
ncbi:MAG: photosystem reaction center subunit H [Novosphingobium sp. SCN 66-18]|nr:MAG: photosystem reaction center subunit H [Novosphingobium sp. SCN 66-18]